MDNSMKSSLWEEIDDFRSLNEFERFEKWICTQLTSGDAVEVQVVAAYLDAPAFKEKWYRHIDSGETWRLVWPDGPFTGLFERVAI